MKIGVRITPWSVASSPARASVRVSVCRSVNCIMSVNTPAPAVAAVRPRDADAATNRPHTSGSVYDPAVRYAGVPDGSGGSDGVVASYKGTNFWRFSYAAARN